jgi:ribonuclease P protein component
LRQLPIPEGYDIVIVARQPAAEATFEELRTELTTLLKRARLLGGPA